MTALETSNSRVVETCKRCESVIDKIVLDMVTERNESIKLLLTYYFGEKSNLEWRDFLQKRKAALVWRGNVLMGVSLNNRWLYTFSGEIVGKTGNRFNIEY